MKVFMHEDNSGRIFGVVSDNETLKVAEGFEFEIGSSTPEEVIEMGQQGFPFADFVTLPDEAEEFWMDILRLPLVAVFDEDSVTLFEENMGENAYQLLIGGRV